MLDTIMPASLQDMDESDEIAVHVCIGVLNRVPDTHLGGKMDNDSGAVHLEHFSHAFPVREIEVHKSKTRERRELGHAIFLQLHIIIVIQVVQSDDFMAFLKKPFR
jgi:hypothetical protein